MNNNKNVFILCSVSECSGNMKYSYGVTSCGSTCRSLSVQDNTCQGSFTPVDGCVCPEGTYLNEAGSCVHADQCPCYKGDKVIESSGVSYIDGEAWYEFLISYPMDCWQNMNDNT